MVSRAYSGYIEYVGAKLSAVRPGPPKAWSSWSITSLEPLAAHTCSGRMPCGRVLAEVRRERGAQLAELPVRVAVQARCDAGHRRGDVGDDEGRRAVGVLVDVELHGRHVEG